MKQKWCDQSKLNLSIDIVMLLLLMPLAGIGFLIKYVLIPGVQRNERYGSDVDLEFLGLTRHEWGSIHLIISIIFLVLLMIHIILHWKMVVCIFGRMIPNKNVRIISATLLTGISVLLIAFPLFIKPEIVERESLHLNRKTKQQIPGTAIGNHDKQWDSVTSMPADLNEQRPDSSNHTGTIHEIKGSQTLQFVADKYGIPAEQIAADLNIPATRTGEKLGRLKRQYSFTMDDVRNIVLKYKK